MPLILPFIITCLDKLARVDLHFEGLQSLKRWITGQDGDSAWYRNQYLNVNMDWGITTGDMIFTMNQNAFT